MSFEDDGAGADPALLLPGAAGAPEPDEPVLPALDGEQADAMIMTIQVQRDATAVSRMRMDTSTDPVPGGRSRSTLRLR